MSDLDQSFQQAQVDVKTLTSKPSNDDLLSLYSLYKQGSNGDVTGKRPGRLDMVNRAKYDAWAKLEGCLLYTSPSPRDGLLSRMPSSA